MQESNCSESTRCARRPKLDLKSVHRGGDVVFADVGESHNRASRLKSDHLMVRERERRNVAGVSKTLEEHLIDGVLQLCRGVVVQQTHCVANEHAERQRTGGHSLLQLRHELGMTRDLCLPWPSPVGPTASSRGGGAGRGTAPSRPRSSATD